MSFCLVGAGVAVSIAAETFSLSWTHTIEKTEWREEWRVEETDLVLEKASVKGSGAGMEPPAEAVLEDGSYVWRPAIRQSELILRREQHSGDWTLCAAARCDSVEAWLGRDADPVAIYAAGSTGCADRDLR